MKLLAYGEDALTLWALQNRLPFILKSLGDRSNPSGCTVLYRPSFGRGGRGNANFGEFDFILLADKTVYLGESKWDRLTGKVAASTFKLAQVQTRRHRLMRFYIEEWTYGPHSNWGEFVNVGEPKLVKQGIDKQLAPAGSDLQANLVQVLGAIRHKYATLPTVRDVFLLPHNGVPVEAIPELTSDSFQVVAVDCSEHLEGNYIRLHA